MSIFLLLALLSFCGTYWLISKKLNIENKIPYNHVNDFHRWAEIILLVALIVGFGLLVLINPTAFKSHHMIAGGVTVLFIFRAFMEWKFAQRSKRFLLSLVVASFFLFVFLGIEFIFRNPVPIRLETDQVKEITIEPYFESENSYKITITDKELIKSVLSAISKGEYQIGTYPITPRLEMIIKLKNGREIVIEEFITRTLSGDRSVIFMVHTERILFPRDMMLHSQELEIIFEDFADKRTLK